MLYEGEIGQVTGNSKHTTPKQPKVEILKNIKIHQLEVKLQEKMRERERERERGSFMDWSGTN